MLHLLALLGRLMRRLAQVGHLMHSQEEHVAQAQRLPESLQLSHLLPVGKMAPLHLQFLRFCKNEVCWLHALLTLLHTY